MTVFLGDGRLMRNHNFRRNDLLWKPDENDPQNLQKSTRMGVEVEVEGIVSVGDRSFDLWLVTQDGSLRDGLEFITRLGMTYGQLKYAISELKSFLGNLHVDFSERTSVHMHFDASAMVKEEARFLTEVFMFVEDILYSLVNPQRKHNIYCKPLGSLKNVMENIIRTGTLPSRYLGLNLMSVRDHNSVEFRFMHGTLAENEIMGWASTISNLMTYVRTTLRSTFCKVVKEIKTKEDYINVVQQILGEHNVSFVKIYEVLDTVVDFRELVYNVQYYEGI